MSINLALPDKPSIEGATVNAGIRPCREGGFRLEKELIDGKIIIHNYGHGGNGISVAPECAKRVSTMVQEIIGKNSNAHICVLGFGIAGTLVVHHLLTLGYRNIEVIAENLPPYTTSDQSTGIWDANFDADDQTAEFANQSRHFYDRISEGRSSLGFEGVYKRDVYSVGYSDERTRQVNGKKVQVQMGKRAPFEAVRWETVVVDTPLFLNSAMKVFKGPAVRLNNTKITSFRDVSCSMIVNCTGYGSKKLTGDTKLYPMRGQTLSFPKPSNINYIFGMRNDNPFKGEGISHFFMVPTQDRIIVGGTYEKGVEKLGNDDSIEKVRKSMIAFFHHTSPENWPEGEDSDSESEVPLTRTDLDAE